MFSSRYITVGRMTDLYICSLLAAFRSLVNKVSLGKNFLWALWFPKSVSFHKCFIFASDYSTRRYKNPASEGCYIKQFSHLSPSKQAANYFFMFSSHPIAFEKMTSEITAVDGSSNCYNLSLIWHVLTSEGHLEVGHTRSVRYNHKW
jgi:hypothetical protein